MFLIRGRILYAQRRASLGPCMIHRKERQWCHLDLFNWKCFIHGRVPRVHPPKGPKTIRIPWADPSSRVTYAFERFAIDLLNATKNQTKASGILRCGMNQVHRMMHRAVKRGETRRSLTNVRPIRMDEKALKRGHRYATVGSVGSWNRS